MGVYRVVAWSVAAVALPVVARTSRCACVSTTASIWLKSSRLSSRRCRRVQPRKRSDLVRRGGGLTATAARAAIETVGVVIQQLVHASVRAVGHGSVGRQEPRCRAAPQDHAEGVAGNRAGEERGRNRLETDRGRDVGQDMVAGEEQVRPRDRRTRRAPACDPASGRPAGSGHRRGRSRRSPSIQWSGDS